MSNIKTNIKEITVANKRLYKETAGLNKVEVEQVENIVEHMGKFIHDTIKRGLMETVMVPDFGKFRPKQKLLKTLHTIDKNSRTGMDAMYRALTGKRVPVDQLNLPPDETI